ncbi:unnamed protein product [Boreogadus saida]
MESPVDLVLLSVARLLRLNCICFGQDYLNDWFPQIRTNPGTPASALFELKLCSLAEEVRKPSLGLQGVKRRMFQSVPWYSDEDRCCVPLAERKNPHIFLLAFLL